MLFHDGITESLKTKEQMLLLALSDSSVPF